MMTTGSMVFGSVSHSTGLWMSPYDQKRVDVAVCIPGKEDGPDHINVARDRGRIEHDDHERPQLGVELVNEPSKQKGGQIPNGPGDDRDQEGVFDRGEEGIVVQEEVEVILHPTKLGACRIL